MEKPEWKVIRTYNILGQIRACKNRRCLASMYTGEKIESIDIKGTESRKFWGFKYAPCKAGIKH